jgi:zinc transport system permease protein
MINMTDIIILFSYGFIQKAVISGVFIGVICAVLGLFLVLRNMSFIGDGLSHISFGALALGLLIGIYPYVIAIPIVLIGSMLVLLISKKARLFGDAAIAIVSSLGMALGIIFASISGGFTVDIYGYLFGNILAIQTIEVWLSMLLSAVILAIIIFFYNDLFSSTFDEEYARTTGIRTDMINTILVLLTSLVVILSVKMVGALLVSALIVIPAVSSLQLAKSFKSALIISVIFSIFSVLVGILVSFVLNVPTGTTIVLINIFLFILAYLVRKK